MHHHKLCNMNWSVIEERFRRKLSSTWKAKHMSYGAILVLLNSVLSILPISMMSFFEIPKGVLKRLDFMDRDSFSKAMMIRRNSTLLSGTSCVILKIKRV